MVFLAAPICAWAAPASISGNLDNRYSDNVTLSSNDEISDTETRVSVGVVHQTDPGRCNAQTSADVGYGVWWDDTFDPETYVNGNFLGNCEVRPGLIWEVSDNLSQVVQDTSETDTPDNRTVKNVFRTGPRYTLPITRRDQLIFSLQYQNTEFAQEEETDSERYIGTAGWNHSFDPSLSGGLSASTDRAELDNGGEIDTDVVSLNWRKTWAATRLSGSIGFSELESRFGDFEQTSDGAVGELTLERDITQSTKAYLNASRELTDQTSDFDVRFGDFSFNLRETSEVEVTAINMGVSQVYGNGSSVSVGVFANRADYLRVDEQEDSGGLDVAYGRPLSPLWQFQASARYEYETFEGNEIDDQTISVETGLSYSVTKDMSLKGSVGHNQRESDLPTREYDENWISLGLSYRFR